MRTLLTVVVAGAVLPVIAAVRHLPPVQLTEGETVSVKGQGAEEVKVSNAGVASAVLRESDVNVTGMGIGGADLSFVDSRGVFADQKVTVVPACWEILRRLFADDPEIALEIVGGKVILSGATANADALKRVAEAKALDPDRILSQVAYSPEALQLIVRDFLDRVGATNITASVIGREVCLGGRVFDAAAAKALGERVQRFLRDFPEVSVNTEGVRLFKQKIKLEIEFIEWDDTRARNLGLEAPDAIVATGQFDGKFMWKDTDTENGESGWDGNRTHNGGYTGSAGEDGRFVRTPVDSLAEDVNRRISRLSKSVGEVGYDHTAKVGIQEFKVRLNLLKRNGVAKKVYGTTLSTQSGEEVSFQNGGTTYVQTQGVGSGSSGDLRKIDYGYQVTARPVIVDPETVNLDFSLDYSKPKNLADATVVGDVDLNRYQTKSRYMVRPGESIVLSGFDSVEDSVTRSGWPILSRIPVLNWFFSNRSNDHEKKEMLLVVTIDWLVEDSDGARARVESLKERKLEVQVP